MAIDAAPQLGNDRADSTELELALEIRSRRIGFVVLQGTDLLDWGQRSFPPGASGTETAINGLKTLLKFYAPDIVITRRTRSVRDESSEAAAGVFQRIQGELKLRSVRFVVLGRREAREFF